MDNQNRITTAIINSMDSDAVRLHIKGMIKDALLSEIKNNEVKSFIKSSISNAITENMDQCSKVSFVDRQQLVRDNAYKNTERLLYGYSALKKHLENEKEYMDMILKQSSGSVVCYQKNKIDRPTEDQLLEDRMKSYQRSKNDLERIENALQSISSCKGYQIIVLRYLTHTDRILTYEEIAEKLQGTDGFSSNLTEKTVRKYKNNLINKLSVLLFGSDAL